LLIKIRVTLLIVTDKTESVTQINNRTVSEFVATSADNIQSSFTTTSNETSTKSKAYNFLYNTKNFIILNIFMISKVFNFVNLWKMQTMSSKYSYSRLTDFKTWE
jgi:hypothetical protein